MDYPDGDHAEHPPPSPEFAYPDIDETVHYPWQGPQSTVPGEAPLQSVIDPRLYRDLFTRSESHLPDQNGMDFEEDGENAVDYDQMDDSAEDSNYEYSAEETSTEEEPSDVGEGAAEDGDDGSVGRRRRRRRGTGPFSGRWGARGGKGIKRGPRKPLEPSPEFKMLHSEATSAFIDGDYDRAIELVKRAIQINPEMFAAHSLLSEIFLAQGQKDKALTALFNGAHTRPRDASVWSKVAKMILERAGDDRPTALNDVVYCLSRVIDIEPKNYNARFQRAAVYRELGHNGRAAIEYERILREIPHNTRALRHLAETYIDLEDVQKAVAQWAVSVEYYMTLDPDDTPDFSWSDVNIYVELYSYLGQHEQGLKALRSVSRWLLGRRDDTMWEDFNEDDREWDATDSPRRIKVDGYIPGRWPRDSYGLGLPLELRIKLGLFRLRMGYDHKGEALHHFSWLNPDDTSEGARLHDYGDLFREVADALKEVGLLDEALRYYTPIQQTAEYADISYFMAMGDCFMQLDNLEEAENCYLTVAEHDARNIESRAHLARLYESIGMNEQALRYVNEAVLLGRQETRSHRRRKDTRLEQLALEFGVETDPEFTGLGAVAQPEGPEGLPSRLTTAPIAATKKSMEDLEGARTQLVQFLYEKLLALQPGVKHGNVEATEDWLDIADALLREFRSNRVFYPMQRNVVFLGYSRETQRKAGKYKNRTIMDEMEEMAGRLQESLGTLAEEPLQGVVPTDYHGISFDEWLDLFLQYALAVAGQGESEEAYDSLAAAADASIWYHSKPDTRLIHVCWFTCALRVQDEETLANEARWFIKEYQFVTDTYRLFSMLSRLCGDPHRSLFHSSPNMKFMLRQIKAMDFSIPDGPNDSRPSKAVRESIYKERATLTTRDEAGEAIPAEELDVALLVLYGHILYSGNSFYPALNYFFRAYALDPQNPAVLLSIALCYIHHSLKRQSDNRHYLIMQGISFLHEYRRVREKKGSFPQERQEMEFNFARVWHLLGLAHLAVEGYQRVLALGEQIRAATQQHIAGAADGKDVVMEDIGSEDRGPPFVFVEDFTREAAVALQNIYALSGDLASAREVTGKFLVI
ncbi:tetratricopeptide repeat protein [Aspergillus clavatus NRRL 1]|uniref:RNA polymerase III transcription factor TFIIIC subunit (Tfc4), putative n=1 Tax=Aspergillus clavatus (strain ATCC 1007 / CBS 513.65 / DSM 816 / NCTC 3887 / NRRL 1 / QM 1276 / 107) TaxID=344612 RepID=A1CRG5_ASPCL|nr:RNA polymerase III transcription factor TFIIIC subunit (Tfc4), putative [Aspergillus clavatus NRRL 1]EAW08236.1 RNA polymerase III transcription factor TFIIIC subunit (Tfc4), putative [Aspergillus clavatus NRRL 1]